MRRRIKSLALSLMKLSGFFALCRYLTRRKLRILCYHGFSIGDQHEFEDILFMRQETLRRRMKLLQRWGFPVLPLSEGIERTRAGTQPDGATVVTVDDGWYSTYSLGVPVFSELKIPATVYVTTYYVQKQTDVFNVTLAYLLWKSPLESFTLSGIHPEIDGEFRLPPKAVRQPYGGCVSCEKLTEFGASRLDASGRQRLLEAVARAVQVDFSEIERTRMFRLMTLDEVRDMAAQGIDVQLHCHRHRLPLNDEAGVVREIQENREILEPLLGRKLDQFCYPSGIYHRRQWAWLEKLGVAAATTCEPGLNDASTPVFELRRFLDRERATDIEFEAELCGVQEVARMLRAWISPGTATSQYPSAKVSQS